MNYLLDWLVFKFSPIAPKPEVRARSIVYPYNPPGLVQRKEPWPSFSLKVDNGGSVVKCHLPD